MLGSSNYGGTPALQCLPNSSNFVQGGRQVSGSRGFGNGGMFNPHVALPLTDQQRALSRNPTAAVAGPLPPTPPPPATTLVATAHNSGPRIYRSMPLNSPPLSLSLCTATKTPSNGFPQGSVYVKQQQQQNGSEVMSERVYVSVEEGLHGSLVCDQFLRQHP